MIFVHKQFLRANYFDLILEVKKPPFRSETTQGLVSIPKSIRDDKYEKSSSNGHLKLGFMGLSRFYFWFRFLILTLSIFDWIDEQLLSKDTFSRIREELN